MRGHGDIILKSDSEPSIIKVLEGVGQLRASAGMTQLEHATVRDSASNGVAERAAQEADKKARSQAEVLEMIGDLPHADVRRGV